MKHWAGFPSESIAYCLREASFSLGDIEHVAINQDSRANLLPKIGYLLTHIPDMGLVRNRIANRGVGIRYRLLFATMFPNRELSRCGS